MEAATLLERLRAYQLSPTQILVLGFTGLIVAGALLLSLPFASSTGRSIAPIDALFTSASAICVTGLIVLDTPVDFSLFGQLVILLLIQIGGLGYMTAATILLVVLGKRIGMRERMVIQETLSTFTMEGLVRFIVGVVKFTLLVEFTGAALLSIRFLEEMPPARAAYFGIFHAVSAFNNAGFSLFSLNLVAYRGDMMVNTVIMVLIIMGGLGFLVYQDLLKRLTREVYRLSLHTKIVLITSGILIILGAAGFYLFEHLNPLTLQGLSTRERALTALFQSVSSRTAGFNTVDIASLTGPSLYLLVLLMAIGASPGGTGGGVKTSTVAIMTAALWAMMRGYEDVTLFHRRITPQVIAKAFFLSAIAMIVITGATLLLLYVEGQNMMRTLFEVASAAGTVGLSTGDGGPRSLSAIFGESGKGVIILCMVLGRIGPLLVGITAMTYVQRVRYRYPEGRVMIG